MRQVRTTVLVMAYAMVIGCVATAHAQQTGVRVLTEQEVVDMMLGSSIQASRSSDTARLVERAKAALAEGKVFKIISLSDLPDDWTVATLVGVGGGGAWEHVQQRAKEQSLGVITNGPAESVRALGKHIGRPIDALIRFEPAGQTLNTFIAAAELGIPVVDACFTGRAVPELQMQTAVVHGVPAAPAAMVTRWGDVVVLSTAADDYRVEDLARTTAVASGGGVPLAYRAISGRALKPIVIPDSVSESIRFGRTIREANAAGRDPVRALLDVAKGVELFRGTVTKADMRGEGGFTYWDAELRGTGAYAGHAYKLYVKNENIIGWLDGQPNAMAPDLICNLDPKTGDTIVGPALGGYAVGQDVVLISIPAAPIWRTPEGLALLGPKHFGFDIEYVPVEALQQRRSPLE